MRKIIDIDEKTEKFLSDYKKSHGVLASRFIVMAIKEKIIRTKVELNVK